MAGRNAGPTKGRRSAHASGVLVGCALLAASLAGCIAGEEAIPVFGVVIGRVSDGRTGAGVALTTITVGGQSTRSLRDGSFRIEHVPSGTQPLSASAPGYLPVAGRTVEVAGTTLAYELSLEPQNASTGAITGVVLSAGVPVEGATVTAGALTAATDSTGAFQLIGVPVGRVGLLIEQTGFRSVSLSVDVVEDQATPVQASLEPVRTGSMAGAVVDSRSGDALPGVTVSVPALGFSTTTGPGGDFRFGSVPEGDYPLDFDRSGYESARSSASVLADQDAQVNVSLVAPSVGFIIGRVLDGETAQSVSDALVSVPDLGRLSLTDAQGEFSVADLPAGTYRMRFEHGGHRTQELTDIPVQRGAATRLDVRLASSAQ